MSRDEVKAHAIVGVLETRMRGGPHPQTWHTIAQQAAQLARLAKKLDRDFLEKRRCTQCGSAMSAAGRVCYDCQFMRK